MEVIKRIIAWINGTPSSALTLPENGHKPKHNSYVQKLLVSYYSDHRGQGFANDKITTSFSERSITITLSNGVVVHEEEEQRVSTYNREWATVIHRPGNWVEYFIELFEPHYLIAERKKQEKSGDELVSFMTVNDYELFMMAEECQANQGERSPAMEE